MTALWEAAVRAKAGTFRLSARLCGDGSPTLLIGPNGSGKTTLLRTICGGHTPESGRIRVGDRILYDSNAAFSLPPGERGVGYLPQGSGLFTHLDVLDNVAFGLVANRPRPPRRERRSSALSMLRELGCEHLARRTTTTLSGGEQQQVALARALVADPDLLVLDEPLAALDAGARPATRRFLARHLAACRAASLIVTHDARDLRGLGAKQVHVLEAGAVVQSGSPDELAANPATAFVGEFFA
ncbi:MAG: ATP-binding cassette domain-containing protein [Gemmatimonadetes bacterium]|nr:ATP-binding cassette domain-containing protein [Gemmatimonadota bacterium]